jgi:hypothetical protein
MLFWCKKSFLAFGCSANFPPLKDIFKFLNFEDIPYFYSVSQQYLLTCRRLLSVAFNLTLSLTNIEKRLRKTAYILNKSQANAIEANGC